MTEFAAKNQFSETIKKTPFMVNYWFHPRFTIELNPHSLKKQHMDATATAAQLHKIHELLKAEMTYYQ